MNIITFIIIIALIGLGVYVSCFVVIGALAILGNILDIIELAFNKVKENIKKIKFFVKVRK